MDWQILGAFLVATTILLVTPGPVMAIVIGNTLRGGQAVGLRTVLGIGLGEVVLLGFLAFSFLLSTRFFSNVLPWFSLASAAYLAWLAANTVLGARQPVHQDTPRRSSRPFLDGLAVTVSNPTALLFYSAFFLPFVQAGQPLAMQLAVFAALYVLLSLGFDLACVLLIARLSGRRFRSPAFAWIARLLSAAVYLGTSALAIASFLATVAP